MITTFVPAVANALWAGRSFHHAMRFRRAHRHPAATQYRLLRTLLRANADTEYGREYGFREIRTVARYRERVPLTTWEDYAPYVQRILTGERGVLTRGIVRSLIPSSGSTSARKLVPYTRDLQSAFDRAIGPWIVDLYRRQPALATGRAYWSISPAGEAFRDDRHRVPIGFDSDTKYLGGLIGHIIDHALAVPTCVRLIDDLDTFRYVSALFLLRARDLTLISVWHPSFLLLLLGAIDAHWDRLLDDVRHGTLSPPRPLCDKVRRIVARRLAPDARRADELRRIGTFEANAAACWPRLGLISAWGDAHAALDLDRVRTAFPGVTIQPKGLIATEGFVTLPFNGMRPLALRSHFFEFVDDRGDVHGVEALEQGHTYSIVMTTQGGLYRYRLRDKVTVEGFCDRTPSLAFQGRDDRVSDRCGEKLNESFVTKVLADLFQTHRIMPGFATLRPRCVDGRWRYVLLLDLEHAPPAHLVRDLEQGLGRNPNYSYCVRLGQLAPAEIEILPPGALGRHVEAKRMHGIRAGDVKPQALDIPAGHPASVALQISPP